MTNLLHRLLTTLLSAGLAALLGLSVTAHAGTASGPAATVSGTDEDGAPVSIPSDPVTFTMESETAAPLLFGPTEMPALAGDETFFHYFIMSRSNGEDTYTLSWAPGTPDTENVNAAGTVTFHGNEDVAPADGVGDEITEVTLGGTVASDILTAAGESTIPVPDDDDLTDNISNGIANGDQVVINGEVYQVTNVAEAPAASIITVDPVLSGEVSEGTPIVEITDFDVHLEAIGDISDPTATLFSPHSGETYVTITAASSAGDAETASLTAQVFAIVASTSTTYVRNMDTAKNPTDPADADYTSASGALFYSSGDVTAAVGDTLEYAIVAEAGTGNSEGVSFSVTIPSSTPYVGGTTRLNNDLSAPTTDDTGDPANPDSALEGGMDACDQVSCILGLGSTLAWGGTAEATFQVELASALDPTTYAAPAEPALVAWTGAPADACWDDELTPTPGWANGQCMMGGEPTDQAYCNTYADLQAAGSFDYAEANSILTVLLSCD